MTDIEAQEIIDILKAYYPSWEADVKELTGWAKRLVYFDFIKAKTAIENMYFEETKRHTKPHAGKIIAILYRNAVIKKEKSNETVMTTHFIQCIEAPVKYPNYNLEAKIGVFAADINKQNDPDYMLRAAETMRSKYENLYGGKWIIVQEEPEPDTGLRGLQARDKAFADILNGPDTKTKRWLENYLSNKFKKAAKEKEKQPQPIGEILASEIPF